MSCSGKGMVHVRIESKLLLGDGTSSQHDTSNLTNMLDLRLVWIGTRPLCDTYFLPDLLGPPQAMDREFHSPKL